MPLPVDIYECTLIWQAVAGTKHFTSAFGAGDLDLGGPRSATDMADDVYSATMGTGGLCLAASMIDDYKFLGVSVSFGTATGDIIAQHLQVTTGTVSDSCPPSNFSVLVNKSTALGGRRYRGRMFAPPVWINEGAVDSVGLISGSTLSNTTTLWNNFYTELINADIQPVLLHQGAGAPIPTPITAFTVQALGATQRRRMRS